MKNNSTRNPKQYSPQKKLSEVYEQSCMWLDIKHQSEMTFSWQSMMATKNYVFSMPV